MATENIFLETDRLIIRDYLPADFSAVHPLVSEPDIYRYQSWGPNTEEDTKNFIKASVDSQSHSPRLNFDLLILDKSTSEVIGSIGVRIQDFEARIADMGYWIKKSEWGKSYATEACKRMIKFGFEELSAHRIWAWAAAENSASTRVLEKAGLSKEGVLRDDILVRGEYFSKCMYSILESEYKK